jgi:hypothetical protein
MTPIYRQETLLAMELRQHHAGRLIQIITDSWSMTGTLTRVDQHDNREFEIVYPERRLVPSGGEIYAELWIGPWRGQVIGNQPVTVEVEAGTLEAPERAQLRPFAPLTMHVSDEDLEDAREIRPVIQGAIEGMLAAELHYPSVRGGLTRCGLAVTGVALASTWTLVTCPECRAFKGHDDLPPEPMGEWTRG